MVLGAHGVRGWLRVRFFGEQPESLGDYDALLIGGMKMTPVGTRWSGGQFCLRVAECNDREVAEDLSGHSIEVYRAQLPEPGEGTYYWVDLIGLEVIGTDGFVYGRVGSLLATGANDVLVVHSGAVETLIPFLWKRVILDVDLAKGQIQVDWFREE